MPHSMRPSRAARAYVLRVFVDIDRSPPVVVTAYRSSRSGSTGAVVKITYDPDTDTLTVVLMDSPVAESDEDKPGVILDFDASGDVVGFEILDASRRVTDPRHVEFTAVA